MKIAIITARRDPFISPLDMDGGCAIVRNYIKELYNAGHEIFVFTRLEDENSNNHPLINQKAKLQKKAGIGMSPIKKRLIVFRVPHVSEPGNIPEEEAEILEANSFAKNLGPYFAVMPFDVYHYFHLLSICGWLGIDNNQIPHSSKTIFSPLLVTAGRTFEYPAKKRLAFEKRVLESVHTSICISDGEYKLVRRAYDTPESRLVKIPLGIDLCLFYAKERFDHVLTNNRAILITPNTIKPQKRQIEAVNVVGYLKDHGHSVVNVFVGNHTDQKYLSRVEKRAKKLGLTYEKIDYVPTRENLYKTNADLLFLTGQREKELGQLLRNADIGLFPSRDESFGLVVINSMACGSLPVCYDLKAYGEFLIDKQNALAVPIGMGWKGLAKKIDHLLNNREKLILLSKTAVNISAQFSWTKLILEQLLIYSQVIDKQHPITAAKFKLNNWINLNDQ